MQHSDIEHPGRFASRRPGAPARAAFLVGRWSLVVVAAALAALACADQGAVPASSGTAPATRLPGSDRASPPSGSVAAGSAAGTERAETGEPAAATPAPAATSTPVPPTVPSSATRDVRPASEGLPYSDPPPTGFRPAGTRTGAGMAHDPSFQPLEGAVGFHGQLGDAVYRIELPAAWDGGGLVIWAHGFRGMGSEVTVSSPPAAVREAIIESGYAWAASSFSENGYTPGVGADDSLALKLHFEQQFGSAEHTVIAGQSMGGNVVVLALEQFPGAFAGGLSFCGAVGGEEQLDYLLSWGLLAEYFTGIHLPIGESGAMLAALLQANVLLGAPDAPTSSGRRFESAIRELTGGPRPFFREGFLEQYTINFGLLAADPERRTVQGGATSNLDTVYGIDSATGTDAETLNLGIRRLGPEPGSRDASLHPDAVPTSGKLSAPLLSLHDTGDLFVPISLEVDYREKVVAAGLSDLLVQRAVRAGGHCNFSADEYRAAWAAINGWIEGGERPAGEVLGDDLSDAGLEFTSPFRDGDPGGR